MSAPPSRPGWPTARIRSEGSERLMSSLRGAQRRNSPRALARAPAPRGEPQRHKGTKMPRVRRDLITHGHRRAFVSLWFTCGVYRAAMSMDCFAALAMTSEDYGHDLALQAQGHGREGAV